MDDEISQDNNYPKQMIYLVDKKKKKKKKKNKRKSKEGEGGGKIIIKVYNIDQSKYVKELKNLFKESGCYNLQLFQKNGRSRGFGYLYFNDENKANNFIQIYQNAQFGNKPLKCQKKYFNQK